MGQVECRLYSSYTVRHESLIADATVAKWTRRD